MQPDSSQAALQQLQQIQSTAQNPNDILSNQRQQLGVQGAQETVTGLRGAINNTTKLLKQVAPSVMGRTGNSLVTNAQATRQIGNEQAPIQQNLSDQTGQYNQADQDLSQLQQRAQEAASGIYQGQQDKLSYAQNLYNTLYQKEKDAESARQAELDRQEQIRQFNDQESLARQQASTKASAAGGSSFNFNDPNAGKSGAADQQRAFNAVEDLMRTRNTPLIAKTYAAIKDSANRGDPYDKIKLQILGDRYASALNKNNIR